MTVEIACNPSEPNRQLACLIMPTIRHSGISTRHLHAFKNSLTELFAKVAAKLIHHLVKPNGAGCFEKQAIATLG